MKQVERKHTKVIGIVGGMGPQAGVALHEAIIRHTNVEKDQDHHSVVLMTNPDIVDRTAFIAGEAQENPAHEISKVIDKLILVGAEVIGIPCNTTYSPEIYEVLRSHVMAKGHDVTLLHLPDEVGSYIKSYHPDTSRIGVMSTNGSYQSGIYRDALQNRGLELVIPDFDFQNEVIHNMIYNKSFGIKAHSAQLRKETLELWAESLDYFNQRGAEAVLLGCTELSLLPWQQFERGMCILDTTEILAKAMIRAAVESMQESKLEH